jgi:hypothetical protein
MRSTSKLTGNEWCTPTKEVGTSQLMKLVGQTRRRATDNVEAIREQPPALLPDGSSSKNAVPLAEPVWFDSSVVKAASVDPPIDPSQPVELDGVPRLEDIPPLPEPQRLRPRYRQQHLAVRLLRAVVWLGIAVGGGMSVTYYL